MPPPPPPPPPIRSIPNGSPPPPASKGIDVARGLRLLAPPGGVRSPIMKSSSSTFADAALGRVIVRVGAADGVSGAVLASAVPLR